MANSVDPDQMPHCVVSDLDLSTKNWSFDDPFISCSDRIGKMLHDICISAVANSLRRASHGPLVSHGVT